MKEMGKVERRMNSPNLFQVMSVLVKELKDCLPAGERAQNTVIGGVSSPMLLLSPRSVSPLRELVAAGFWQMSQNVPEAALICQGW